MASQVLKTVAHFIFSVPDGLDQEQARAARWLNVALAIITLSVIIAIFALYVAPTPQGTFQTLFLADVSVLITAIAVWITAKRGHIKIAASLLLGFLFSLIVYVHIIAADSINRSAILLFVAIIPLVGLLLGRRSMNFFAALSGVTLCVLFYLVQKGVLLESASVKPLLDDVLLLLLLIATNTILLNVSIRRAEERTEDYQRSATALEIVNEQLLTSQIRLQQAQAELEERVAQRTKELRQSNLKLQAEIEERQRAQNQLAHDAVHDALTGLPNRVLFMDRLQHASALAKRHESYRFAVLFLDLDFFKVVNDSLGHTIGDQLLIAIAKRLHQYLDMSDTLVRLGGDEFVILMEGATDSASIASKVHEIQDKLKLPFNLNGHQVVTSASIGVVTDAHLYERPEDALRDADIAMYHAKRLGKSRFEVFKPYMREQALARLELETDLRHALDRHELELFYQPIVSLETGQIVGFEALLRWRSPTRGLVSPMDFVPIAEETRLILPIGHWVLQEACRQIREWQTKFPRQPPLTVSVNVSGSQFCAPDFAAQVAGVLAEVGIGPSSLKLEITEGIWLTSSPEVTAVFEQLKEMGIQLQLDDFGTGYSSLAYLQNFPIQTIKIDRSFVSRIGDNSNHMEIVRAVITMAHDLGMESVAEGVETVAQLSQLRALGCNFGQGYLLSRPVEKGVIETLLSKPFTMVTALPVTNEAQTASPNTFNANFAFENNSVPLSHVHVHTG